MTAIPFYKFHGFGNDYIVIERGTIPDGTDVSRLAIAICERNTGAGSDGIAIVSRSSETDADFDCEIVNPDGSIAGFSGNGTRCAVSFLYHSNKWNAGELRLRTKSGVKNYRFLEKRGSGEYWFEAEIGKPKFSSDEVPVLTETRRAAVVNEPIEVDGRHFTFSGVNVGNPVACIFVDSFELDWRAVGKSMEVHEKFPERANIVFVKVEDRENIELRIWERGAGETSASGTCASGAAVLSAFLLRTDRKVLVHTPGGATDVLWRDDDEIVIKGKANYSFEGSWMLEP
ncbi:MAG TPA: diaminopimelate epimerase [Pyrinomonadaceae bacterium]|nr:diaminopimelate epimerase [Pyrinomonadaceae bacterium]